jgi:methylated-DNA-[protein]-cysteine S-methyltransferase
MDYWVIPSPVGELLLAGEEGVLKILSFPRGSHAVEPSPAWRRSEAPFADAIRQLRAYFEGDLRSFDLPLGPEGTAFQREVWKSLQAIPYGATRTYGEIARSLGKPTAFRAVGSANGRNPIPIIIPCHRVVGSDGSLTGFGGGLPVKHWLLAREGARLL